MSILSPSHVKEFSFTKSPLDESHRLLRYRLDQLEYKEHFSPDSLALVEHLLSDLIVTTESAKNLKNKSDALNTDKEALLAQIEPLRHEISRLTAENNQLHKEIVNSAEEKSKKEKKFEQILRRHESETADLRFLNAQYSNRIDIEQKRVDAGKKRLEELLIRQGGVLIDGKSHKTEKILQRLQKIELATGLEPLSNPPVMIEPPQPVVVDLIKVSESRIEQLERSNQDLRALNIDLENEIESVREQLGTREEEISRLGAQLEIARAQQFSSIPIGSQPLSTFKNRTTSDIADIADLSVAKQRIEQLELQIEYLQEHIFSLEKEQVNYDQDKDKVVSKYEKETKKLQEELNEERERASKMILNLSRLETMVSNQIDVLSPVAVEKIPAKFEPNAVLGVIVFIGTCILDLFQKNSDKVKKLEKELKTVNRKLESSQSEVEAKNVECERLTKSLKDAMEKIKGFERQGGASSEIKTNATEPLSDAEVNRLSEALKKTEEMNKELSEEAKNHLDLLAVKQIEIQTQKERVKELQDELASKQIKLNRLKTTVDGAVHSKDAASDNYVQVLQELSELVKERDELLQALSRFEGHVEEIHKNVEIVTADRDNLAQLYEQVNQELQNLRRSKAKAQTVVKIDKSVECNLIVSEGSTKLVQDPEIRIRELESEIEKLKSDLAAIISSHREAGASANEAFHQLESEAARLKEESERYYRLNLEAEEKLDKMTKQLDTLREELNIQEQTEESLRAKLTHLEIERDRDVYQGKDLSSKLSESDSNLTRARNEIARLERALQDQTLRLTEQRNLLKQIDGDRDRDRATMENQSGRILELEETVSRLRENGVVAEQEIFALRDQVEALTNHIQEQENQVVTLERQLSSLSGDKDRIGSQNQNYVEEIRNLNADLVAITKENQIIIGELNEAAAMRDRFKSELLECENQIKCLDQLIYSREQESEHLMGSYRQLIAEHEKLDVVYRTLVEDNNQIRMESLMKDKTIQSVQKDVADAHSEMQQYKMDLGVLERQSTNLSRSLATAERANKHLESDKARLLREITAARDLALSVERSKDDMQKQLTVVALESERINALVRKLETDNDTLQQQIRAEKLKAERLEHLLSVERTKKIHIEKAAKDIASSKGGLEEQLQAVNEQQALTISTLTNDLGEARAECNLLRGRIASLEQEMKRLKNELSTVELESKNMRRKMTELQENLDSKNTLIAELTKVGLDDYEDNEGISKADRKLLAQLRATTFERMQYEDQLAGRNKGKSVQSDEDVKKDSNLSPSPSDSSQSSRQISIDELTKPDPNRISASIGKRSPAISSPYKPTTPPKIGVPKRDKNLLDALIEAKEYM
ncbi:hypothetical protein HK098_006447 [Nowakowskiella sp. JEL0407]|nr:hypothetical protein HK098_006447 [Nowakowskiella sp. JEL0407]